MRVADGGRFILFPVKPPPAGRTLPVIPAKTREGLDEIAGRGSRRIREHSEGLSRFKFTFCTVASAPSNRVGTLEGGMKQFSFLVLINRRD